jgi:hypothetical protein
MITKEQKKQLDFFKSKLDIVLKEFQGMPYKEQKHANHLIKKIEYLRKEIKIIEDEM